MFAQHTLLTPINYISDVLFVYKLDHWTLQNTLGKRHKTQRAMSLEVQSANTKSKLKKKFKQQNVIKNVHRSFLCILKLSVK